jgi:SAM-dependent methyltransferase
MKEEDIRPAKIFEEYLSLSANDAEICFSNVDRKDICCPACGSLKNKLEFDKHGFEYSTCTKCGSLYQSPRPPLEAFERFYNDSISSKYWAECFFPSVAEARRERIFKPRVKKLVDLCEERNLCTDTIMDVGAGHGIFLEEWKDLYPNSRTIAIEPSHHLSDICRNKGLEVAENIAEKVLGYENVADLVICFEVLEHVHDPLSFIKTLSTFVKAGGYLMVSTLGIDGFDIQTLWEKSNSISPPHHINFMSVSGFKILFERAGLAQIEVFTPGLLDVDIVRNAYKKDPSILAENRFIKKIVESDSLSESFQQYLADEKLSSHTWVFAKKT